MDQHGLRRLSGRRRLQPRVFLTLFSAVVLIFTAFGAIGNTATAQSQGPRQLVVGVAALAVTLDPAYAPGGETSEIMINVYDRIYNWTIKRDSSGLASADVAAGDKGIADWLLEKTDVSPDGTVYTMHVRKGIKSSAGNELTADDIRYTYIRLLSTKRSGPFIIGTLVGIKNPDTQLKVLDPYTLQMTLPAPNAIVRQVLYGHNTGIVDSKAVKAHATPDDPWAEGWMKLHDAGFGPYTATEFTAGSQIVLKANPNYWGKKPYYGQIIYREVPDPSQRLLLLRQGDIDVAEGLSANQIVSLKSAPKVNTLSVVKTKFVYVALNNGKSPMDNKAVRQALQYAVPQQDIINTVYGGKGEILVNTLPRIYPDYDPSVWTYKYDIKVAKSRLAAAGYPNGFTVQMLVNADIVEQPDVAVQLADSFGKAGVKVNIIKKPVAAYLTDANASTYDMVLAETYSVTIDVCYHFNNFINGKGVVAYNHYGDLAFLGLLAQCNSLRAGSQRDRIIAQLQKVVADQIPTLSVAVSPRFYGMKSSVKGYIWNTYVQLQFNDLHD